MASVSVPVPTVPVVMIPLLLFVMAAVVEQSSWVSYEGAWPDTSEM